MQCRIQLGLREVPADSPHELMLPGRHGVDRTTAVGRQANQRRSPVRGVRGEVDEARISSVMDHPLHELTTEVLRSRHLGHGELALSAELVEYGTDADRHPHDRLSALNDARHLAIERPQLDVDLGQARGEGIGVKWTTHEEDYDTRVVNMHRL